MTTTLRRCCATCAHFRWGPRACLGWCDHPERRPETDARLFVRDRELACRAGWTLDLWEQRDGPEGVMRVVGLHVWGPFSAGTAPDELPGDLLGWLVWAAADDRPGDGAASRGLVEFDGEDADAGTPDWGFDD